MRMYQLKPINDFCASVFRTPWPWLVLAVIVLAACIQFKPSQNIALQREKISYNTTRIDRTAARKQLFRPMLQVSRQHLAYRQRFSAIKDNKAGVHLDPGGTAVYYYSGRLVVAGQPVWHMIWLTAGAAPSFEVFQTNRVKKSSGRKVGVSYYSLAYEDMSFCGGTTRRKPSFDDQSTPPARKFNWRQRDGRADFECAHSNHSGRRVLRFYKRRDLKDFVTVMTSAFPRIIMK